MTFHDDEGTTVRQRLARFITESRDAGITWQQIVPVAAVSVNESGSVFRRLRRSGPLPIACYPTRQVLALEMGNPFLGSRPLPQSWLTDAEIMDEMQRSGWLGTNNQATRDFGRGDLPDAPNDNLAAMFEWLLDRRKLKALQAFSIGPTQMFLDLSPLTGGAMQSRFATFEALWDFYTARDVATSWRTGAWDYLMANPQLTPAMQACGTDAGSHCVENWLQTRQTGFVPWTDERWRDYARRFKQAVDLVWEIGQSSGAASA